VLNEHQSECCYLNILYFLFIIVFSYSYAPSGHRTRPIRFYDLWLTPVPALTSYGYNGYCYFILYTLILLHQSVRYRYIDAITILKISNQFERFEVYMTSVTGKTTFSVLLSNIFQTLLKDLTFFKKFESNLWNIKDKIKKCDPTDIKQASTLHGEFIYIILSLQFNDRNE